MSECQFCFKKDYTPQKLKVHETHCSQNPNRINAKCKICGMEFATPQKVSAHSRATHKKTVTKEPQLKRPYVRREKPPETNSITLLYCPCCGTNLRLVAQALLAVGGIK